MKRIGETILGIVGKIQGVLVSVWLISVAAVLFAMSQGLLEYMKGFLFIGLTSLALGVLVGSAEKKRQG